MSQENVEVVRQPLTVAAHSRRRLEDHLVRFPRLVALFARMPPRWRLRQALLARATKRAFEATNRRDFEVAFRLYHADVESILDRRIVSLGFEPVSRGREARIDTQRRWVAEWEELRFELEEVIDLGRRVVVATRMVGSGVSSGAAGEMDCVFIYTLAGGRVIREQIFFDRGEALEAAGLRD